MSLPICFGAAKVGHPQHLQDAFDQVCQQHQSELDQLPDNLKLTFYPEDEVKWRIAIEHQVPDDSYYWGATTKDLQNGPLSMPERMERLVQLAIQRARQLARKA